MPSVSVPRSSTPRAVDDVSFDIYKGEIFGIIGESGSGKSTIGRCVLKLIDVDSGEIYFDGKNITHVSRKEQQEELLPQGLHLLAGAPKIGKSWLALWLCLRVAQGEPLWNFSTKTVAKFCTSVWRTAFQRIQSRLFDFTEDAPPSLHFAVMSEQLHSGLVHQIERFLREHPATGLVVIDTLQRIRTAGNEINPYASDYRDIGVLKALADRHRIAVLLIHHLRKLSDEDPMNMISGTTGLSGATDSNFVLRRSKRENTATLYCTGRDISYRELSLEFDGESHVWNLLSDDCGEAEQSCGQILFLLSTLLRERPEICAPAKALLEKIDPDGTEGLTPNSFSHKLRKSVDALRRSL